MTKQARPNAALAATIQDKLRANCEEASATYEMLAYINDKEEFRELFRNTQAANGLNVIYGSLLHNLVFVLSRIFDPVHPSKGRGMDRASLPHLMHMLDKPAVRKELGDAAREWLPLQSADKWERRCYAQLDSARAKYAAFEGSTLGKSALAGLRWLRDHHLAHSLFQQRPHEKILYGQLKELLDVIYPIVHELERAIKGNALEHGWPIAGHHYAYTFWPLMQLGMKARAKRGDR